MKTSILIIGLFLSLSAFANEAEVKIESSAEVKLTYYNFEKVERDIYDISATADSFKKVYEAISDKCVKGLANGDIAGSLDVTHSSSESGEFYVRGICTVQK